MQHPEPKALAAFAARTLPPQEALAVSRHIVTCEPCREQLATLAPVVHERAEWFPEQDPAAHLSEEEIVDAAIDPTTLSASANQHLATCHTCRAEVTSAQQLPVANVLPMRSKRFLPAVPWAIAATAFLAFTLWHSHHATAVTTAQLNDGNTTLALNAQNNLVANVDLTAQDRALLAHVLQTHQLPGATNPLSPATTESLRAEGSSAAVITLQSPRNQATLLSPTFAWSALPRATSYRVEIYNAAFRRIASSPALSTTEWTPAQPLASGMSYIWVVRANTLHGEVVAPEPPAPPAAFTTISASDLAAIQQAQQQHPQLHLLLATLYARAGMKQEALAESAALLLENPNSEFVKQLQHSLQQP